jgi:hypothetical protein
MAAQRYSEEELLRVRQKSLQESMHRRLYERLRTDADLGKL